MDDDDSWRGQEDERQAAIERYNDDTLQHEWEECERSRERDEDESYRRERGAEADRKDRGRDTGVLLSLSMPPWIPLFGNWDIRNDVLQRNTLFRYQVKTSNQAALRRLHSRT